MNTINIQTKKRNELIDITAQVQKIIERESAKEGICTIFCPHTTAGLTINENADPSVKKDILNYLSKLIPESEDFTHSEGNSDSHIKASLLGSSLQVIVEDKRLVLGTWQGIYFCEFDGPRSRSVFIHFLKGE
jgi:secondary thiamine-phosphate synthase enzyme